MSAIRFHLAFCPTLNRREAGDPPGSHELQGNPGPIPHGHLSKDLSATFPDSVLPDAGLAGCSDLAGSHEWRGNIRLVLLYLPGCSCLRRWSTAGWSAGQARFESSRDS